MLLNYHDFGTMRNASTQFLRGILIGFVLLFGFARIWMFKKLQVFIAMPVAQFSMFLHLPMCHTLCTYFDNALHLSSCVYIIL